MTTDPKVRKEKSPTPSPQKIVLKKKEPTPEVRMLGDTTEEDGEEEEDAESEEEEVSSPKSEKSKGKATRSSRRRRTGTLYSSPYAPKRKLKPAAKGEGSNKKSKSR